MATGIAPIFGRPGFGTGQLAQRRNVSRSGALDFYPAGGVIEGTRARDPGNSAYSTRALRAGLLMGKITSGGYWANSVIGLNSGAVTGTATSLTLSAAAAAELVRRVGTTGTFKLTGPPTASGTVRTLTVTYSAVDTTTGVVTITALGVNEVQTVNLVTAGTAGNLRLIVQKTDGTFALTPNIAWNATDATLLSNANTALDTATGVVGGIVATAISATDTDLGVVLTYSGTGYAGASWALAQVHTLFTSNTGSNVVRTTTGVDGRFVTLSMAQPTDGSETIRSVIPDGYGLVVPDDDSDTDFAQIPCAGTIDIAQILDFPSDASLRTYVRDALNTHGQGVWLFSDKF